MSRGLGRLLLALIAAGTWGPYHGRDWSQGWAQGVGLRL